MGKQGRVPACVRQRNFEKGVASGEITHHSDGREISKAERQSYANRQMKNEKIRGGN